VGALDGAGAVVATQRYWPYGATRSGGVTQTDKLYTGQQAEPGDAALGLYNYRARFYSTTLGRFVCGDPVVADAYDPQAWNPYTYVRNNPLRYVDPSGEFFDEPGDSTPLAQQGQFCGRDCRALKSLAAAGFHSAAQVQAHIELVATLQYLAAPKPAGPPFAGSQNVLPGLAVGAVTVTVASPLPLVDDGAGLAVAGGLLLCSASARCRTAANDLIEGLGSVFAADQDWDDPREHPEILTGMDAEEVEEHIPEGWVGETTPDGHGTAWHPVPRTGEQIRVMRGYSGPDVSPDHAGPYAVVSARGRKTHIPLKGNPELGPQPEQLPPAR